MKPILFIFGMVTLVPAMISTGHAQQALDRQTLDRQTLDQSAQSPLPKGYQEVDTDQVVSMRKLCEATAKSGSFSGAVLVAKQGKVLYKDAFGMANLEWNIANSTSTKFRLASVSKQFCSLLVLQLVEQNKIELDAPITEYLPYYRKDTGDRITIHHLLAHQSGIPDFTSRFDYRNKISRISFGADEFIELHCSGDLLHDPGTIYSYCNAGYCILGRIVEKLSGKTFEQNLQEKIFSPLGMRDSGVDRNRTVIQKRASGYTKGAFSVRNADFIEMDSTPGPAGGIYSTVEDMFLWDRALYTNKLLSSEYRDRMFTPNRNVPEVKAAGGRPHSVYGYGWQIFTKTHPVTARRTRVVHHGGAINGFRAIESRLIEDDAFVMILCNLGDPVGNSEVWNVLNRLNGELIHIVTNQPYRMPPKPRLSQDQRMHQLVRTNGVESAIEWFSENGKKAAWGGSLLSLVEHLFDEGLVDDGLRLMEFDVEMTPNKIWLLRKTAQAFLDHGRPGKAVQYAEMGLSLRPDEKSLESILSEAEQMLSQKRKP